MQTVKEKEVAEQVEKAFALLTESIKQKTVVFLKQSGVKQTPENINVFLSRWTNIVERSENLLFMEDGDPKKTRSVFFQMCTRYIEVEDGCVTDQELMIMYAIFDLINEL